MNSRRRLSWLVVFAFWIALGQSDACLAADTLKIGNAGVLAGGLARVPVFVRDASGTALNRDGTPIQSIRFRVIFNHPELIDGCKTTQFPDCEITFIPGGVLAGLKPSEQNISTGASSMAVQYVYDQTTAPIPFHLDQPAPGDSIGFIEARIVESASLTEEIDFTVDVTAEATALSNASGTISETFNAGLFLFGGTIKISECTAAPTTENVAMNWSSSGCSSGSDCVAGTHIAFHASGLGDYKLQSCDVVTWDFGDGTSEPGQSTTHNFTATGVYTVAMTVTNPSGTATVTREFVIKPDGCLIAPVSSELLMKWSSAGCSAPETTCVPGDAVTFTADALTYDLRDCHSVQWTFSDGTTASGPSVTKTFSAGPATVGMKVSNELGQAAVSRGFRFGATGPCRCTALVPGSVATFASAEFAVAVTDCQPVEYLWDFGDGSVSTTLLPSTFHSYDASGLYAWSLAVLSEDGGCELDGTITVQDAIKRRAVRK